MKKAEIEELREYRNLKASGRLFVIPEGLKDGDTVWVVTDDRISSHMIVEWVIVTGRLFGKVAIASNEEDFDYLLFAPEDIGIFVFRTKEEAEASLIENGMNPPEEEVADVGDNREDV